MDLTTTQTPQSETDRITQTMEALDKPPPHREPGPPDIEPPVIRSPTLHSLDKRRRPRPATACEECPNSVWFTSPTVVKCYCRVMYVVTWSTKDPNQITACDGMFVGRDD